MNKTIKRFTAAVLAGVVSMSLTMSASAEDKLYDAKCTVTCAECNLITTATLNVTMTRAVATTGINSRTHSVLVSVIGYYFEKDTGKLKNIGNGNGCTVGTTTSISNNGGKWTKVTSNHSKCCSEGSTTLSWPSNS
ncbi:MAG: hypothetical protein OSJ43_00930 [Oscillospiraceae bacterium]|nr:hypothetical protein [Oscillospiraceae bacterium]